MNISKRFSRVVTTALVVTALVAAPIVGAESAQATVGTDPCIFTFIAVRGSGEAAGQGSAHGGRVYQSGGMGTRLPPLSQALSSDPDLPIYQEALLYPATVTNTGGPDVSYSTSIAQGTQHLVDEINYLVSVCPYVSILLAGYSQGAQVIGNALDPTFSPGAGIAPAARSHISSVTLYADPSYVPNQTWDAAGNGIGQGLFHRGVNAFSAWTRLAYATPSSPSPTQQTIIRSYCLSGDEFCQAQFPFGGDVHANGYTATIMINGWSFMRGWLVSQG